MDVRASCHEPAGTRHRPACGLLEPSARPPPAGDVEDGIAPVLARRGAHPIRTDALKAPRRIDPRRVFDVCDIPLRPMVHQHPARQPAIPASDAISVTGREAERFVLLARAVKGLRPAAHLVTVRPRLVDDVVEHHLLYRHRLSLGIHHTGMHPDDVPVESRRAHVSRVPRRVAHLVGLECEWSLPHHHTSDFGLGGGRRDEEGDEEGGYEPSADHPPTVAFRNPPS
jgi:hypothetical protein